MGKLLVAGFMATSDSVPAYGGVELAEQVIVELAQALRAGKLPHTVNHDAMQRLDTDIRRVQLRRTDTGSLGVWVEMYVDEDQWRAAGDLRGFSITGAFDTFAPDGTSGKPIIELFADAGQFDAEAFNAAIEALRQDFAVGGGRLYQFSFEPPPNVIIDIAVGVVSGTAANLITGALKAIFTKLFAPKHASESIFTIRVRDGDKVQTSRLTTSNPEVAKIAAETWRDAVLTQQKDELLRFDNHSHTWTAVGSTDSAAPSQVVRASPPRSTKNSVRRRAARKSKKKGR